MSVKQKQQRDFLQLRINRDEKRGAELVQKLEKISEANGLSLNDVANLAVAAGLGIVETNLKKIHEREPQPA